MDLNELIARLEAAKEGSRELDKQISVALGLVEQAYSGGIEDIVWRHIGGQILDNPQPFTRWIDAALMLKPEGWLYNISTDRHASFPHADAHAEVMSCFWPDPLSGHGIVGDGHAATAPLALCIAALKARIASAERRTEEGGV